MLRVNPIGYGVTQRLTGVVSKREPKCLTPKVNRDSVQPQSLTPKVNSDRVNPKVNRDSVKK